MGFAIEEAYEHLIILRVFAPHRLPEVFRGIEALREYIVKRKGTAYVLVDLSACGAVDEDVRNAYVLMMRNDNELIVRSALWLGEEQNLLSLQVFGLVQEAGSRKRQAFRRAEDVQQYLAPGLPDNEIALMKKYFQRVQK